MNLTSRIVIGSAEDFLLMKSYLNAEEFISDFISLQPIDVVLMDINLPGKSGIQCIRELKMKNPSVQFLVCTIFEDSENLFNALCAGATGYILKNTDENELLNSIRLIHTGGSPMSPQIARRVITSFPIKKKILICSVNSTSASAKFSIYFQPAIAIKKSVKSFFSELIRCALTYAIYIRSCRCIQELMLLINYFHDRYLFYDSDN